MKALVILSLLAAGSALGADFSLHPTADAFVSSANPTGNYGAAGALSVAGSASSKGRFESLLKFDLAPAKASFDAAFGAGRWTINSVKLQFTASLPNNAIFNSSNAGSFSIRWMQNDTWAEGTGTPASPGATGITSATLASFLGASDEALGTFSFSGATSGANLWELGLATAFVVDATSGEVVSFLVESADGTVSYTFNSRTFTTTASRPLLMITAIPEPGAGALLGGTAAVWLTGRRRYARAI